MTQERFNYHALSDDCIKCGKCIPVCTIHQINPDETTSPRGFIDLLGAYQDGKLELDKNAKNIFESCFLCTNCVDVCPNSLQTDMVIEQVRYDIAKTHGLSWFKKLAFKLLRHRWLTDLLAKIGYYFVPCGFKKTDDNAMLARFSLPFVHKNRKLPALSKKSFLNTYPEHITGTNKKVAVFIGCLANYSYTGIGDALIKILKTLEVDTFIPKKQLCCGAPAYFTGDFETVDYLTSRNLDYFETFIDEVDAIIVPEATCSAMIKQDWAHFYHDKPDQKARAEKIAKKIYLATEWLYKEGGLHELLRQKGIKQEALVTYHDPCHARKVQGVFKEPRVLLAQGYNMIEMSEPNRCCGFGGVTMQTEKFDLAKKAGEPKAKMIDETQANIVAAECSACRIQLSEALNNHGSNIKFQHPLELIAKLL